MTDSRPSENTDPLFAAAAEYGRTHLGWKADDSEAERVDLAVLALRYVGGPGVTTPELDVQKAQAYATLALVEQQRIANLLQFQHMFPFSHPEVRDEIEKAMGLS